VAEKRKKNRTGEYKVPLTRREIRVLLDVIDDWEEADRYCSKEWEKDRPVIQRIYRKLELALVARWRRTEKEVM
jgi:hypothetical protein